MEALAFIPVLLFFLVFGVIGILGTIFWIWMLIDCITKETDEGNSRLIWVLVIIFTHIIGSLIYFFIRKQKRV